MKSTIDRKQIEESSQGILQDTQESNNLLVSFGGRRQGLGMPVFEFFDSLKHISCDKFFFRDFHQSWYQKGADEEINSILKIRDYLEEQISQHQYQSVCFIGNSMGGYASLLFGTMLNINRVIAFAPQTFVDRVNRLRYLDRRWRPQIKNVHNNPNKESQYFDLKAHLVNQTYDTELNIFYSPNHRLDKIHAERMKNISNVTLHSIPEGGHGVVKEVRDSGRLLELIEGAF